jgi:hypothetical protein
MKNMQRHVSSANLVFWIVGLTAFTIGPLNFAVAHEAHRMECTETSINAMNTDIQAMDEGGAKTSASKEMEMAIDMMAKKDMKACETHLHNAMEEIQR